MSDLKHRSLEQLTEVRTECLNYICKMRKQRTGLDAKISGQLGRLDWINHYINLKEGKSKEEERLASAPMPLAQAALESVGFGKEKVSAALKKAEAADLAALVEKVNAGETVDCLSKADRAKDVIGGVGMFVPPQRRALGAMIDILTGEK